MKKDGKAKLTRLEIGALVVIVILAVIIVIPKFISLSEEVRMAEKKQFERLHFWKLFNNGEH